MKKVIVFLSFMLIAGSFLVSAPSVKAVSQAVTDSEFLPDANYYGSSYPPFVTACTRFVPSKSSYTNYFDLAVKNGQGSDQPITASLRSSSGAIPGNIVKSYTQSTYNNYADGNKTMSRFVSNDSETVILSIGANYWLCIDSIDADAVNSGWFYKANGNGYSYRGINTDVTTDMAGVSFGYRTYAFDAGTPSGDTPGDSTGGTSQGTTGGTTTTGNSKIAQGAAPSNNISSAIAKPTGLTATYNATAKAVVLTWKASTTSTIGGYNVYRSETASKDYKKIGDTGKTTVTLSDANITASATYYYMVRAYKDIAESANSNEAFSLVPVDAEVKAKSAGPVTVAETPKSRFEMTLLTWGLSTGAVLLLGILILLILRRKRQAKGTTALPKPLK